MSQKPYNEWMFEFWGEKYAKFQTKHGKAQNVHFIREIWYGRVGEIGAVSGI